jgi:hypothetical protein
MQARNNFEEADFWAPVMISFGALPVKETDKEYHSRRGGEERKRARSAATAKSQAIHKDLADLHHERANGSANVNGRTGIKSTNRTAARASEG